VKAVMYHYVRPGRLAPPHFRYLPLDSFRRQLDHFQSTGHISTQAEFEQALASGQPDPRSVVLTFDDGLRDHHDYVLPELRARGLWGLFYVATLPHVAHQVLDVHKVHLALGRRGGRRVLEELENVIRPEMLEPQYVAQLSGAIYQGHVEDEATALVKRWLNYYLKLEHRSQACDEMFQRTGGNDARDAELHYASRDQLRTMRAAGLSVGAHSVRHRLLSQLSDEEQAQEVLGSIQTLSELLGEAVNTFCFPYGGAHSFNAHTLALLERAEIRYCFSVEPRDISASDLRERPLSLPRYDCNVFPHGTSHVGPSLA
jgi:peptidoglycan/xylan/chitin deacetylase (PgdA/CDA1 family)